MKEPVPTTPRPDTPVLGLRGPHHVGVMTERYVDASRDRPLTVELWYPTAEEGGAPVRELYRNIPWRGVAEPVTFAGHARRDALPLQEGFPVVLYAHGAPGSRLQSTRLCEHLASHGYLVAAIDFTFMTYGDMLEQAYVTGLFDRPRDLSFVLDSLKGSERFSGVADTSNAAIIGYSFGGYTALAACGAGLDFASLEEACTPRTGSNIEYVLAFREWLEPVRGKQLGFQGDERLKAAFVMAPWNAPALDLPQVTVPVFVAGAELDVVAPLKRDAQQVFERISSGQAYLFTFERAGHNIFTDPCLPETRTTFDGWDHCHDAVWDKERSGDILRHCALAFLNRYVSASSEGALMDALVGIPATHLQVRA